jgi:RNA polymerase sigma-70 factor (ECF subfamily)
MLRQQGVWYHGRRPRRGPRTRDKHVQGPALASRNELSTFLAGVERRAFKQALFAVRDEDAALDIVQDSMLRLAEKYGANPAGEFPMLFQRILQNAIRDWFRRQKVRSTWTTLLSAFVPNRDDSDESDPLDTLEAEGEPGTAVPTGPAEQFEQAQIVEIIENEIRRLPPRQREAFLLRYWEELDVAETAAAMGCSEGSVKTHCSRATHSLASALKARGIEL